MKNQSLLVASGGFTAALLVASVILALVPNARSQGSGTACVLAPAGLVGWWQAEGNANDSAGGNNGSITGTVRFVPGEVGLGFEFDGATSAVAVPASPNLTVKSLTIEAWVFPYDVRTPRPIVEFAAPTGPGYVQLWYGLKAAPGGAIGATGALYGAFRDPGGAALQVSTAAGAIPSNEWTHVALTFDASTRTSLLYVNGLNIASNTSSVAINPNTSVPVNLGYRPSGSSELLAGTRHLGGLDEVSIYNRALSAAEIQSIYNADDAGKCPIAVAPRISSQPASQTISVGGTATFNVTVSGSQPLSYQWRFNGGDLTGQTGSSLVLSNAQPANGGNYAVLVSNAVGSIISSNAVLTVVTGQTNCVPPPSGLVGWWRGEGNANDSAGTNNGVLVNGAGFAPGEVGQSFVFTNLDQSVEIPDAPALDPTNGLSLEAWVRLSNYPNNNGVIVVAKDIYNVTPPQYEIAIYQTGSNSLFQIGLGVTPSTGVVLYGTTPLQTNTWYHVAVTYDSTELRLYVNGQPETSMPVTGSVVTTTGALKFGGYGFGPWTLPGQIDEVSLYNRPLSSSEVQALYSAGSAGKCMPLPSACVPRPSGLVSWWRAEGDATDTIGGNSGTLVNGAGFGAGKVGQAFAFGGGNQVVVVSNAPSLNPTSQVSVEAWVRLSAYPASDGIVVVAKEDPNNWGTLQYYLGLRLVQGQWVFEPYVGVPSGLQYVNGATPVLLNTWYHAALTYDGVALKLYVNGNLDASAPVSGLLTTGTIPLTIGGFLSGPWNVNGLVDEVSIYNRALSAAEVQGIYVAGSAGKCVPPTTPPVCVPPPSGLVSWWRAEGNAKDSADSNDGVLLGGTTFGAGEVGQAFSFDGVSNSVRVAAASNLDVGLGAGLTLEAWVKPSDSGNGHPIIEWSPDVVTGHYGVHFWVGHPSMPPGYFYANIADTNGNWHVIASVPGLIQSNVFQHVAVTYDKASGMARLFLNGAVVKETNLGVFTPQTSYNVFFGKRPPGDVNSRFFAGLIDEISVYNRALGTNEVQGIYTAGSAGKCVGAIAPTITVPPASQTVSLGSTAILSVVAAGSPPLSYQWLFNGGDLTGQTGSSLVLSNVQPANGGNYSVLVSNIAGFALSSNAVLTVVTGQTNCVPPPSGLVGWWRGEGNANDSAGTNNGVLINSVYIEPGLVGQCFHFVSGPDPRIRVPDSPALQLTNSLTIEGWIKANLGWWLLNRADDMIGDVPYGLGFDGALHLRFIIHGTPADFLQLDAPQPVPTNVWLHVAATLDSATGTARIYVNGQVVAETNTTLHPMGVLGGPNAGLGIGNAAGTAGFPFDGWIDEISLYSRALSQTEIQSIYNAGSAGKCATATAPAITSQPASQTTSVGGTATFNVTASGSQPLSYQWRFNGSNLVSQTSSSLVLRNVQPANGGNYSVVVSNMVSSIVSSNALLTVLSSTNSCVPPPSGLVGWWRGEGNGNDSAGTNNGVLINSVFIEPGLVGQCFHFVSGSNPRIRVPDSPALQLTNSLTIEGWIKANLGWWLLNRADDTIGDVPYGLGFDGALHLRFIIHGTPTDFLQLDAPQPVPTNVWLHVAATLDAGTTTARIYVNGQVVAETNTTLHPMGVLGGPNAGLGIGNAAGTAGFPFDGWIDEISLYSRALSQAEIQAIYHAGSAGKCTTATAPAISSQPASQTISVGGTATFNVTASGSQPLSYQWLFNGSNVAGQTASSLVLSNVQAANGGNYSVLVSNVAGSLLSSNALLTVVTASTNCVPPPAGLVSWWRAEGNAGDAVGTNDGILLDGTTFATGEVGQAFALDGLSDSVRIPASTSLNIGLGAGFTLEAWVKPFNAGYGPVMEWSRNPGGAPYGVHLWIGHPSRAAGYFYANIADTNGNWHVIDSDPGLIQTNVFQHVAVTYDKTTGTARLFLNGTVVRELNLGIFTPQTSYDLYLGERPPGDVNSGFFAGLIDEPSVYSRALSPAEIQSVYAADGAGKCTAKLALRACNVNAGTVQNQSLRIAGQDLVALGSPSGSPLALDSVSSSSTNGAAVSLITNCVVYLPPANYIGSDRFTYTMNDGSGAAASGYVLVQVRPANLISGSKLPVTANLDGFRVSFAGSPGHSYILQRAPSVIGPWSSVGTVTIGSDGLGTFTDTALPSGSAFYRTVSQ